MISFAYPRAKVNVSLYITGRRRDGYHSVDTIYWPLPLFDYVSAEKAPRLELCCGHRELEAENNLVLRAWALMRERFDIGPVKIFLEKGIPWQAGLGGGSADGAAMLLLLNSLFELGLREKELLELAAGLGADVPLGILGKAARGRGTGTELEVIPGARDTELPMLIIKPDRGFSTGAMYGAWDEKGMQGWDPEDIEAAQQGLCRALKGGRPRDIIPFMHNDFEYVLGKEEQAVFRQAQRLLEEGGALKSLLCGSGSAVLGLYESEEARQGSLDSIRGRLPGGWGLYVPLSQRGGKEL